MYESTLFLGLCALAVKDLGCHTAQQHSSHHGQQGLRQHIAAVVHQAVGPGGQTVRQVAPDQHTGQEAAQEPQEASHESAHSHADNTVLEGAGKELCQAERHEGEDVIQQDFAGISKESRGGRCPETAAQQDLQAAVDKSGEQAPLDAVAEGHQHKRQHTQGSHAAAVGQGEEFDVGQHGADGDHQRAFHQHAGLGVGFRHRDSSLFYKVHKNKNAPAEITAGAWVFVKLQKIARTPANSLRRHCPDQVKGTPLSADLSLTAPLFLCPWSV